MIVVKLMGGLGNQMFQYATARAVAQRNKTSLYLDTAGFFEMADIDTPRHYDLGALKITGKIASKSILTQVQPLNAAYKLHHKIIRRLKSAGRIWQVGEPNASYFNYMGRAPKNTYLVGWWQNQKYFNDIREILLNEFQPAKPLSQYSQVIIEKIADSPVSVAIHVRRGDYIANKQASKFHGLTPLEYYRAAATYFQDRFPNALFVVFSDDIAWCKQNLELGNNVVFVEPQKSRKDFEDLVIMTKCSHSVIANSSFSWWGAWLNINPNKIIIAPKVWFQDNKANSESEIVPSSWIRL